MVSLLTMRFTREITVYGIVVALFLFCAGCDGMHTTKKVDGHTFTIPNNYLIQPNIPWLPASQRAGLMFILNPADSPQKQVIVLLQEGGQECIGKNGSAYMHSICGPPENGRFEGITSANSLMKNPPSTEEIQSFYVRKDNPDVYIASCVNSPTKFPELGDLCSSIGEYKGLRYTIQLREKSVPELSRLVHSVNSLLQAWEK
jgi:hypothetical protein